MTPWTAAHQASLSFTISQSLLKLMSIEPIMPFHHLSSVALFSSCPQTFPASVFSNELALCIGWPEYCSFSFSISPSNEYLEFLLGLTGLIFLYLEKRVGGKFDNFGWVFISKLSLGPEKQNREKFMVLLVLEGPSLGQDQRLLLLTHSGSQVAPKGMNFEIRNHIIILFCISPMCKMPPFIPFIQSKGNWLLSRCEKIMCISVIRSDVH